MNTPYDFLNKTVTTANSTPMLPDLAPKAESMQFPVIPGATINPVQATPKPVVKPVAPTIASAYQAPAVKSAKATVTPTAAIPTPTVPTATVPTPTTPTVTGLGGMAGNINDIYGDQSYYTNREGWLQGKGITEEAEKAGLADRMQQEINASNALYAEKLRQAKIAGEARLGGTMAVNQTRGAVGGSFGRSAVNTQAASNQDVYNTVEQERAAAETAIRTGIATLAKSYYDDKKKAAESNYKDYIAFKKGEGEYGDKQAEAAADYIIAAKSNPDSITEDDAKKAGTTLAKIKNAFLLKKNESTKAEAKRLQEITDKQAEEQFKADLRLRKGLL